MMINRSDEETAILERCKKDPSWAATEISSLRRLLSLIVQQVDIEDNDSRTLKIFRGGTLMDRARILSKPPSAA